MWPSWPEVLVSTIAVACAALFMDHLPALAQVKDGRITRSGLPANPESFLFPRGTHVLRAGGVRVKKGVDIAMAVEMLSLAQRNVYDTAVLVTGDGDFAYAVQAVEECGKHVENVCTPKDRPAHFGKPVTCAP